MFADYILPFCLFSFYIIFSNYGIKIFKAQWNHRDQKSTNKMLNLYLLCTQGILSGTMIGLGILWRPNQGSSNMGPTADVLCWLLIGTGFLLLCLSTLEFFLMLMTSAEEKPVEEVSAPELELSPEEEEAAAEAAEA